ncbi:MAG: SPW repeat protein [Stellaceae bacterium]
MTDVNGAGGRSQRWQDWANLVLAVWLFISPWVLGFATGYAAGGAAVNGGAAGAGGGVATNGMDIGAAAWNAWVFGVIVAIVALAAMASRAPWQEWINLLIGIWVFVAPWVLGFTIATNPAWDQWIVGALLFLISLSALSTIRRNPVVYSHAGQKPRDLGPIAPRAGGPVAPPPPAERPLDRPPNDRP